MSKNKPPVALDSLEHIGSQTIRLGKEKRGFSDAGIPLEVDKDKKPVVWVGNRVNSYAEASVLACIPYLGICKPEVAISTQRVWFVGVVAIDASMTPIARAEIAIDCISFEPMELAESFERIDDLLPLPTLIKTI